MTQLVYESTTSQLVPAEVESLFAKELAKRGISSTSVDDDGAAVEASGRSLPPPQLAQQKAAPSDTPQLEKSRALNSEGLEGLIPRASVLIRLGGGFFLGFVPFILLVSMLFVGMYVVWIPGASLQPIQSLFPCLPMNMPRTDIVLDITFTLLALTCCRALATSSFTQAAPRQRCLSMWIRMIY